jgi:hypothetical protein
MATSNKLHNSGGPPPVTATRATQLILLRDELEEERLELERAARTLDNESKRIKSELMRFVRAHQKGDDPIVELAKHRLEIIQVDGFFSYKDTLIGEIGFDEFERRRNLVPAKDDLAVTEKRPASSKAVTAARDRAASLRTKTSPGASKKKAA